MVNANFSLFTNTCIQGRKEDFLKGAGVGMNKGKHQLSLGQTRFQVFLIPSLFCRLMKRLLYQAAAGLVKNREFELASR